jgi:hypothetical protein
MSEDAAATGFRPPPDDADRTREFLERHGGAASTALRRGERSGGLEGWFETEAADGWVLRCEWSRLGSVEEIKYTEVRAPDRNLRP